MDVPKVSVLTPAFNAKDRVADIAKVVGRQTYPNCEHIIINDGSLDETSEILCRLAQIWPNLRVVNQKNLGRSAARNRGVSESTGAYLLFLDDDDSISANAIAEMVTCALGNPGAAVITDWHLQRGAGLPSLATASSTTLPLFEIATRVCPFAIHGCLFPRFAITKAKGFDTTLSFAEDWDLWQRLGRAGQPFVRLPKPLVTYNLPARELSSEAAHLQYQQCCVVIERGFHSDQRVADPLSEFEKGCPNGCAEHGMVNTLAWFAGIEYAQSAEFPWILECAENIIKNSDYMPNSDALAMAFAHGLGHGRGLEDLDTAVSDFPRLRELTAAFGLSDSCALVPRLTLPNSLPVATSEVQHVQVGWRTNILTKHNYAGRVQLWRINDGEQKKIAQGIYALGNEVVEFKFNHPVGIVLALFDQVNDKHRLRSLVAKLAAMVSRPSLVKNVCHELGVSSVDLAVRGSILPNLPMPTIIKSQQQVTKSGVWEEVFSTEDPWGYDKPYEVRKYEETLELLSDISSNDVLTEMACAEGHFTVRVAPLVRKVRAYDVSSIALERLNSRLCHEGITNVDTAQFDLLTDQLAETSDVVICSEVLYYVPPDRLTEAVERLIAGLKPGGVLVHAHAFEASERESKPGFGWFQPFGAQRISAAFGAHPELQRCKVIETDLYLVERYEKTTNTYFTEHDFRSIDRERLEPDIAHQVLWSGYRTRPEQADLLRTTELPVLTYHSIGEGAPQALQPYQVSPSDFTEQLSWLRENGYRSPAMWEVSALLRRGRPIKGKAILITFDDAYQCFADTAWPLLKLYNFNAVMFAATSFLGDAARWDARFGDPMKIMDSQTLAELAAAGLIVGSHSTTHRPMTHLSTSDALEEMLKSREELQNLIGQNVDLFAFPYGVFDPPLSRLTKYCGYSLSFTTSGVTNKPFDNPYTLGRFIVDGSEPPLALFSDLPGHTRVSKLSRSLNKTRQLVARSRWAPQMRYLLRR